MPKPHLQKYRLDGMFQRRQGVEAAPASQGGALRKMKSNYEPVFAYGALAIAIVAEVTGSSMLQKTEQFSKLWPTVALAICFVVSLFFLSHALKVIPLGVAYAIWGGMGIVLTAMVSVFVFRMSLDLWAMVGIGMIVGGVLVMNLLSHSVSH